jgi:uncharacterized protein YjlB
MYEKTGTGIEVEEYLLEGCERFPNNSHLPLLIYRRYFDIMDEDGSRMIRDTFEANSWTQSWINGIYDYHHYHSTAHEVLGVAKGKAVVNFGGISGVIKDIGPGDVIVIPAGVAHKCLSHSEDFKCVGAYPVGQNYNILTGGPGERPAADEQIARVPDPETDPLLGASGPLLSHWSKKAA